MSDEYSHAIDVLIARQISTLDKLIEVAIERDEAREILLDVIIQATTCDDDGELDSMALTSYAIAMRYLAEHGLINIKAETGRRVIAALKAGSDEPKA